jgi:hypothetical protein
MRKGTLMPRSNKSDGWLAAVLTGVLLSCWACSRAAPDSNPPTVEQRREQVQQSMWTGSFHLLWGDPAPTRPGSPQVRYRLVTDRGEVLSLLVSDSALAELGGPRGLNGKRVTVTGDQTREGTVSVKSILLARQDP